MKIIRENIIDVKKANYSSTHSMLVFISISDNRELQEPQKLPKHNFHTIYVWS